MKLDSDYSGSVAIQFFPSFPLREVFYVYGSCFKNAYLYEVVTVSCICPKLITTATYHSNYINETISTVSSMPSFSSRRPRYVSPILQLTASSPLAPVGWASDNARPVG